MMMIMITIISTMTTAATTPAMIGMRFDGGGPVPDRRVCIILYSAFKTQKCFTLLGAVAVIGIDVGPASSSLFTALTVTE